MKKYADIEFHVQSANNQARSMQIGEDKNLIIGLKMLLDSFNLQFDGYTRQEDIL